MMIGRSIALCTLLSFPICQTAAAQHHGHSSASGHSTAVAASPYAGMTSRAVKALSDEQIADLKTGRGMGLALAAELNGFPGPLHVLELADVLELTGEQREKTKQLFGSMKAEVIPIGEQIVSEETALDKSFADKSIARVSLDAATGRIGAALGALRAAHLRYHLTMIDVLTAAQLATYAKLRGYTETNQ